MPDPYDWLGVPKAHRPPTHYQLLGLPPSVKDPADIKAAADRQLKRLQPHLTGPDGNAARTLRAEISRARDTLLDPEQRAIYDTLSPDVELIQEPAPPPEIDVELVADTPPEAPEEESPTPPEPWWKEEPPADAPAAPDEPWWKQAAPADEQAPASAPTSDRNPKPSPPVSTKQPRMGKLEAAKPGRAPASAPVPAPAPPIVEAPSATGPRRLPVLGMVLAAIIVAGVVTGGAYFGLVFVRKHTTAPKEEPGPVTKGPVEVGPNEKILKEGELLPSEGATPKDFADKLRPKMFRGHQSGVSGVAVAKSGLRMFTVGTDKTVRVWSVTQDDVTTRHRFLGPGVAIALYEGDNGIAACDSLTVALLDSTRMKAPKVLESPRGGVSGLAVTADGSKVLTGMTDGSLRLWDTAGGKFDEWAIAPRGPIAVAMTPDGSTGIAAPAEGPVSVWDLKTRAKVNEWAAHPGGALSVQISPDNKRVVTAGPEGAASVYDLAAKREVCRMPGHTGPVTGAAWLADGKQVVTVGTDGIAKLWNAETGLARRWAQRLDGKATCVAVDSQDRFILVGTTTGTVHLFPLPRVKAEALSGPAAKPPADPLPVPTIDAVQAAMAPVKTELATEFGYTRPDDVALLADNLRRRASAEGINPALRFGLLQEARGLAVRAADAVTAVGAVEDLAAWFDLDELAEKAVTLNALPPETDPVVLSSLGLLAVERAEPDARPEVVQRVLKRLPAEPPAGLPKDQADRLAAARQRAKLVAAELDQVRKAANALRNAPDDQGANNTLGVFLALTRQDWENGLPHLARGSDPGLVGAAKADLNTPTDVKGRFEVGDAWFRLAVSAKDSRYKRSMLGRARTWYQRITGSKAEVADMVKAQAKLRDVDNLNVPSKDPTALPLLSPVIVRRAYNTLGPDVVKGEWQFDGGAAPQPTGVRLPAGSPVLYSRFGLAPRGTLTLVVRPDGREIRVNGGGREFAFAGIGKSVRIVVERTETTVTVTAYADDEEPVTRTTELPVTARGPSRVTLRVTGVPADPNGMAVSAAMARGPVALPLPAPE